MCPKEVGKSRHRRRAHLAVAIHDVIFCSDLRTHVLAKQWIFRCQVWINFEEKYRNQKQNKVSQGISNGVLFFFFHTQHLQAVKQKAKWIKYIMQHANFYFKFLRIIHQIAFVLQVRFHIVQAITIICHPRRLFIAKGKFLRVLMHRVFFNQRQIFPPIRGTSHSRSGCTFNNNITNMHDGQQKTMTYIIRHMYILYFI